MNSKKRDRRRVKVGLREKLKSKTTGTERENEKYEEKDIQILNPC